MSTRYGNKQGIQLLNYSDSIFQQALEYDKDKDYEDAVEEYQETITNMKLALNFMNRRDALHKQTNKNIKSIEARIEQIKKDPEQNPLQLSAVKVKETRSVSFADHVEVSYIPSLVNEVDTEISGMFSSSGDESGISTVDGIIKSPPNPIAAAAVDEASTDSESGSDASSTASSESPPPKASRALFEYVGAPKPKKVGKDPKKVPAKSTKSATPKAASNAKKANQSSVVNQPANAKPKGKKDPKEKKTKKKDDLPLEPATPRPKTKGPKQAPKTAPAEKTNENPRPSPAPSLASPAASTVSRPPTQVKSTNPATNPRLNEDIQNIRNTFQASNTTGNRAQPCGVTSGPPLIQTPAITSLPQNRLTPQTITSSGLPTTSYYPGLIMNGTQHHVGPYITSVPLQTASTKKRKKDKEKSGLAWIKSKIGK